jgi:hypothetical protein
MAKAKKKSAKETSNTFHNIMAASVGMGKKNILTIEEYLKSSEQEMNQLGSTLSTQLNSQQRKEMVGRLNLLGTGKFEISKNKIIKIDSK